MDIYPQDLGPEEEQSIWRSREAYAPDSRPPEWDDFWSWPGWIKSGVAVGAAGAFLSFIVGGVSGQAWLGGGLALVSGCVAVYVALNLRVGNARPILRLGPLTIYEVNDIKSSVTDPLRRPYLELVIAALNTPPVQDVESQQSVREALRALGESITGLPPLAVDGARDDPAAFEAQAEQLSAEAAAECDPVIAASLRRRADALRRQAETAERTNTLLRRNDALRQEIAGHIAALRTSLTALRVGGAQAVYELADVAANIQQVAIEAGAITQARSEIGDIVNAVRREPPQAVQQVHQ